jgi:acyl-CoA thioesterase FadM
MHEDEYTIVESVTAPGEPGTGHHLVDYQTQEMVSKLWSQYLAKVRAEVPTSPILPAMRRVSYSLDSEAFAGQALQRGIKVLGRTQRSCTFAAALWHAEDGRMVHTAELVTVFIEPAKGAVAIPDDFWAAVEGIEGRAIPVAPRTP